MVAPRSRGSLALALSTLLTLAACSSGGGDGSGIQNLTLTPVDENHLAAVIEFRTAREARPSVRVLDPEGAWTVPVSGVASTTPGFEHQVLVLGLRAGETYGFVVEASDPVDGTFASDSSLAYTPGPLPESFPPFEVTVEPLEGFEPGLTLMAVNRFGEGGGYYALDGQGRVVWYHLLGEDSASHITRLSNGSYAGIGAGAVEIDPLGRRINEEKTLALSYLGLHHDVFEMENGHLLALGLELREVAGYPGGETLKVVGDLVVEMTRDWAVLHVRSLFDVLDPHRIHSESFHADFYDDYFDVEGTKDWTHGNSVVHDPSDDSLVVSLRTQDMVLKMDRATGTLRWIIGEDDPDTPVDDDYPYLELVGDGALYPNHQHNATIQPTGNILVYDNGTTRQPAFSRTVEYAIDPANLRMGQVSQRIDPDYDPPLFAVFAGGVERTAGGTLLVADPSVGFASTGLPSIHIAEALPGSQQKVWELWVRSSPDEGVGWWGYRASRISSLYPGL